MGQIKKQKQMRLLRDIVIPAGSLFNDIEGHVITHGAGMYRSLIGLTKDTFGDVIYSIDKGDPNIGEWFEEVK